MVINEVLSRSVSGVSGSFEKLNPFCVRFCSASLSCGLFSAP